jgi:hypothetical protein
MSLSVACRNENGLRFEEGAVVVRMRKRTAKLPATAAQQNSLK